MNCSALESIGKMENPRVKRVDFLIPSFNLVGTLREVLCVSV